MHGIILAGYYDDTGSVFHNRSPGSYKISDHCREHGWNIEVIDYISRWNQEELKQYIFKTITNNNSSWVGISYTWLWKWNGLSDLLFEIKKQFPQVVLIAGGQTPYNKHLHCDWYVYGYAEDALIKVLDYEFNHGLPLIYEKLFDGKYVNAVHNYPSFNTKDYSIEYDNLDFINDKDILSLELSRGCKFKCSYCNFPFIGIKEDTSTTEELLYRELNENYQKYGVKNYIIADDTANDRLEKLIKFSKAVSRLDFEPNFSAFIRADLMASHPEQIEIMAEARLWAHYYGVETFNREAGRSIGKGQDPEKTKDILLKTKEYFLKNVKSYRGTIGFIAGLPHESMNSLVNTQDWCKENWIDQHWLWWPLQITRDRDSLSAFGKDLSKFGYRPLSKSYEEATFLIKNSNNNFLWENDYTDIIEVEEFCKIDALEKLTHLDNFAVMSYIPFFGLEQSQKIETTLLERYNYSDYRKLADDKILNYIQNKLSL